MKRHVILLLCCLLCCLPCACSRTQEEKKTNTNAEENKVETNQKQPDEIEDESGEAPDFGNDVYDAFIKETDHTSENGDSIGNGTNKDGTSKDSTNKNSTNKDDTEESEKTPDEGEGVWTKDY